MFGIGFAELLIICIMAILFLGPDKLPQTLMQIAKFFNETKRAITSAKNSIEEELHLSDMRREIDELKESVSTNTLSKLDSEQTLDTPKQKIVKFSKESGSKSDV